MGIALYYSNPTIMGHAPVLLRDHNGHSGCHIVGDSLVANGVFDPLFIRIKVAFFIALIVTCPVWLYQLWAFIAPGLYSREKRWAYMFTGTAVPLFVGGAFLAYYVMGRGLKSTCSHGAARGARAAELRHLPWLFHRMLLGFGIAFELPLVLAMLNIAGILTHERFRKWRKALIFSVFVFAGMVNPSPDPWTMLIFGGLCVGLVEIAEVFVYFNDKRHARLNHPTRTRGWPTTSCRRSTTSSGSTRTAHIANRLVLNL